MEIVSLIATILMVMDPFGNVVTINALLGERSIAWKRKTILRESLFALVLLAGAALAGTSFLGLLGLEPPSLSISGGIILFVIALGMVFPRRRAGSDDVVEDPFIVPIAMPLIAGPSSISMVLLFANAHGTGVALVCVLVACAISTAILGLSPQIFQALGHRGAVALERLTGMILILLSVQMVLDGVEYYLQGTA